MANPLALIVDDEPDIRELLEITLARMQIDARTADSLASANDWLRKESFQLCLTDMHLPDGSGTTTIESKTNFMAPAPVGTWVTGEATPVHRGRRTQVWQTRITGENGKLVALVTQTQMVL